MRFLLVTLIALSIGTALAAQPNPHTTTIPEIATGTYLGASSSFPLGRTGGRVQYWYRGDGLPTPSVITAIGPRASRSASGAARTQSLEVTAANTALSYASFTNDFVANLGASPTIVYARKMLSIPAVTPTGNFDQPGVWILLDAPFPLLGPNLVLDFDLGSAVGATSASYTGDLVTLSGIGRHWSSDPSCGGSLAAAITSGRYDLTMTGATPSAPAWLALGVETTTLAGVPLPFDLTAIGMTGCLLGVDPLAAIGVTVDATGTAFMTLPIPPGSAALALYAQGIHSSAANPLGLATTNVMRSLLGATGFCRYIYNFTSDGPLAQNGPLEWQAAMLLQ